MQSEHTVTALVVGTIAIAIVTLAVGVAAITSGNNVRYVEATTKAGLQQCQLVGSTYLAWQKECK